MCLKSGSCLSTLDALPFPLRELSFYTFLSTRGDLYTAANRGAPGSNTCFEPIGGFVSTGFPCGVCGVELFGLRKEIVKDVGKPSDLGNQIGALFLRIGRTPWMSQALREFAEPSS